MNANIIACGKTKDKFISIGIEEYLKRLNLYGKVRLTILPDVKLSKSNNIEIVKKKESEIILRSLNNKSFIISLSEIGQEFSSKIFSQEILKWEIKGEMTFIIGGVYGLHKDILEKSNAILSLSQMTFTHQMVRLILLEQIYRAYTIINNKKYHY